MPRIHLEDHLSRVRVYGFSRHSGAGAVAAASRSWLMGGLHSVAEVIGRVLLAAAPKVPAVQRADLTAAGYYDITPEAVHGFRVMALLLLPGVLLFLALAGGGLSMIFVLLIVVAAIIGWEVPAVIIRSRGRARLDAIDRSLPQFIDLVVATVEAGISFGGALNGAASRFSGPLGDELRLAMHQQNLGLSTDRALGEMLERVETPAMRSFVRAVGRAESHGVSIGPMMRHLAHDIRQRRRDIAREKIQKAPIKLMFPLVTLILPALLMTIMFPAMYNLLHILHSTA
jgi:Flp pilus assembly protein TadB